VQDEDRRPRRRRKAAEERFPGRVRGAGAVGRPAPEAWQEDAKGVYTSVEFLQQLREERHEELGRQVKGKAVAVIGGGSVAMDCVESALKLGARDAYLVYRRSFTQMPAEEEERLAALRLGVHFLVLNQPTTTSPIPAGGQGPEAGPHPAGRAGRVRRRKPEQIKGAAWTLDCSLVVEAIGNRHDEAVDWSPMLKTAKAG